MTVRFDILEGPDRGQEFRYPANSSFVVGRDVRDRSGLRVPSDPYMSRNHFLVVVGVGDCLVRDCGSSNGLFVNEEQVKEAEVRQGDAIRAGRTRLVVHFDAAERVHEVEQSEDPVAQRFELKEPLEGGGAARVFRAVDRESGAQVALKFLRIDLTDAANHMPLFARELEAAKALTHANIVPVLGTGVRNDEAWLAAEWIDGPTLEQRIERGPLYTERQAVDLGRHLLQAIAHAHDSGFVHRDIKPANIMLKTTEWGAQPMLTDFGLAKRLENRDSTLTSTGTLRGTPRFMPPEQVLDSRSAGVAADQFSLAATIYFAATGRWHYDDKDETIWETLLAGEVIPVRGRRRGLSAGFESILLRAMQRQPERRYESAGALCTALERHRASLVGETLSD